MLVRDAALELRARRRARESMAGYASYVLPEGQQVALHHALLCVGLDAVERGECDRLLVMMPPGSAKSTFASVMFPAYFLGRNPQLSIIAGSHTAELAERFGRRVRNEVASTRHRLLWNSTIASDSQAAGRWETDRGGEYFAAGVGGSVTGRRADCVLADTMVRAYTGDVRIDSLRVGDHVLAQHQGSPRYCRVLAVAAREATELWRVRTRSGHVVVATGNHRFRVGALWKTAETLAVGDLLVRVLPKAVEEGVVRDGQEGSTQCGVSPDMQPVVRDASEQREPGSPFSSVVQQLRATGESTCENVLGGLPEGHRRASGCGVAYGSGTGVRDLQTRVSTPIERRSVQVLFDELQERVAVANAQGTDEPRLERRSVGQAREEPSSAAVSPCESQRPCEELWHVHGVLVQGEAGGTSRQPRPDRQPTEQRCGAVQPLPHKAARSGQEQTETDVVSLVERLRPDGGRVVVDIQVEGAENFFANGILVHNCAIIDDPIRSREDADSERVRESTWQWWVNDLMTRLKPHGRVVLILTRWHEDDIAGRLLQYEPGRWKVIKLPMEAREKDPLNRKPGERLWPEWFTEDMVVTAKRDARAWSSLYQQEPRPKEGADFKLAWIQRYSTAPPKLNKVIVVDPASGKARERSREAAGKKTGSASKNDWTTMWVVGLAGDGNAYLVDGVRDQLNLSQRIDVLMELHRKHKPLQVRYEDYGLQADIQAIQMAQEQRQYRFKITPVAGRVSKEARIRRLIPWFEHGRLWLPMQLNYVDVAHQTRDLMKEFVEQEYTSFPVGVTDDMLDALARLDEPTLTLPWPREGKSDMHAAAFGVLDEVAGY